MERIYFVNKDKVITFGKSSPDYTFLFDIIDENKEGKLKKNSWILIMSYLDRNISLIIEKRNPNQKNINTVNREYNGVNLILGRNIDDIRLLFLIDFRELLIDYSSIYMYLIPNLKEELKNIYSDLKKDFSIIDKVNFNDKSALLEYGFLKKQGGVIIFTEKSKRIPSLL